VTEAPSVLVIQTAFLGDVVLTTPLFGALKELWPAGRVTALVIPATAPILEGLPAVDDVIVHDKRRGGWRDLWRVLREVRRRRFELVISPHRSARSALIAWASGARRIGYRESALRWVYTATVHRPWEAHETERVLALLAPLGAKAGDAQPRLALREEERAAARRLAGEGRYAVVSPSSAWPTKRWTPEGFAAVGDWLAARGYRVVITGGPGEREVAAAVAARMDAPALNVAGETTARELAALVAGAALLVANDSAPVHVASAFDTPTVAIFGATVPAQGFGPRARRAAVAEVAGLACRPCGAHGGRRCAEKHFKCMLTLTPAEVIRCCETVLV